MLSKFFRKLKARKILTGNVKVSKFIKDYSKEDVFLKRAREAQETLDKYGYPEMLTKGH